MYSFEYDEEAVIQEADIFTAEAIGRGNYLTRLKRKGICVHDGVVGLSVSGEIFYPEQEGLTGAQVRCWDCKTVFQDSEEWMETCAAL